MYGRTFVFHSKFYFHLFIYWSASKLFLKAKKWRRAESLSPLPELLHGTTVVQVIEANDVSRMLVGGSIIDICGSFTRPIMTVPFLNLSVKFLAGLFVCFSPQHVSQPHAAAMLNYTNFSQRSLLFSSSYLFISQEHVIFSFLVTILVLKMLQLGVKGKTQ